jgi:hypothetical protein
LVVPAKHVTTAARNLLPKVQQAAAHGLEIAASTGGHRYPSSSAVLDRLTTLHPTAGSKLHAVQQANNPTAAVVDTRRDITETGMHHTEGAAA